MSKGGFGLGAPSMVVGNGSVPSHTRTCAPRGTARVSSAMACATSNPQNARRIFVVDLAQNRVGQMQPINAPAALRRNRRGRVVKVFVICFQKPIVNLVELVHKKLLRGFV